MDIRIFITAFLCLWFLRIVIAKLYTMKSKNPTEMHDDMLFDILNISLDAIALFFMIYGLWTLTCKPEQRLIIIAGDTIDAKFLIIKNIIFVIRL